MTGDLGRFDAAVVGAGPAGSVCAFRLARGGARVILLDRAVFPRHKTCGGGIVGRAASLLPIRLEGIAHHHCRDVELRVPDAGVCVRSRAADPIITMVSRRDLDAALVRAASDAGATLAEGFRLRRLEAAGDWLHLTAGSVSLRARIVVAADGAAGSTARLAGWTTAPRRVPALDVTGPPDPDCDAARFVVGEPRHGYAWSFPKQSHRSVGTTSIRRAKQATRMELEAAFERSGIEQPLEGVRHGFVIPVTLRPGGLARGRVLLVGDAAGTVDPLLCEGISGALLSGSLAADAILAQGGMEAAPRYERSLRPLRRELAIARALASLLYDHPSLRREVMRRFAPPLCDAMLRVASGRLSYRQLLARAPAALARALFERLFAEAPSSRPDSDRERSPG